MLFCCSIGNTKIFTFCLTTKKRQSTSVLVFHFDCIHVHARVYVGAHVRPCVCVWEGVVRTCVRACVRVM